jgi:PAS domain S-box-containing protein
MSILAKIADTVQRVAEAISMALGIETEIVDNSLTIIGGSSVFKEIIGEKEELGAVDGSYLYARVLRTGKTIIVTEAATDSSYGPSSISANHKEKAEICTPIKIGDQVVGVIGLIALNENQRLQLIANLDNWLVFLERMADLLGAKASEFHVVDRLYMQNNEMIAILETIHEGMLAVDQQGIITHCNSNAEGLLKTKRNQLLGRHLREFMSGTPALQVIETGTGYTEREEFYRIGNRNLHIIVTAKPIHGRDMIICGVVLSFRDISEARRLIYNMSETELIWNFEDIIGHSEALLQVKKNAMKVMQSNSTLLITGESGTGKELFARAIHYASSRKDAPFINVNCGAIPENLLESELFGYDEGAFTGARKKGKSGKFELADGGTIFLDEIADMPLHLQVSLLHVLQNRCFERVGGNKTIFVDVRVIAATNKDIEVMIAENKFREDLYYRLNVIPLRIPSLRERRLDIPVLMEYFLVKYSKRLGKNIKGFTKQVIDSFINYSWPGNIRELENSVEYAVNMAYAEEIGIDAIPGRILKACSIESSSKFNNYSSLQEQVKDFERNILNQYIEMYGYSHEGKLQIAKELSLSRATIYRRLAKHNLK